MKKVGLVTDDVCLLHTHPGHPEHAGRLQAVLNMISESGLEEELVSLEAREATREELERNHHPKYVENIVSLKLTTTRLVDADTYVTPDSPRAALVAYGAGLTAVERVLSGELERAFVAVRPPGHHAEYGKAMGFCIFNNIAGAAHHAKAVGGVERVAIIDFDVHHGNGTQWAFYQDPTVHFTSWHQYPFYPGTGAANQRGKGDGEGFTLNIPLEATTTGEEALRRLEPAWSKAMEAFKPELILISAGFDAHKDDPLAAIELEDRDFYQVTKLITEIADRFCSGRIVSFLEGGYDLAALARSCRLHLEALLQ